MNHSPGQSPQYDDEISLVDLAATFVKRRRIFYVVFLVITLGSAAYAMLAHETYQYTSLLQSSEKGSGEFLEEPATTIATLQNRWLPEQETLFRAETDERMPFEASFANPEDTGLIRIVSEATSDDGSAVQKLHQNLIDSVTQRHKFLIERERQSLLRRIDSVDRAIQTLKTGEDGSPAIAEAFERKVDLEGDLEGLKDAEVLVVSRQSAEKTGPAKVLVVVLGVLLGAIGGVFSVFFVQFATLVRLQLAGEHESDSV